MPLYELSGVAPQVDSAAWIADSATVIGDVSIGADCSIWYGAVIRGDNEPIRIDAGTNIQEGAVLHADPGFPLHVAAGVTVGHQAMLHGCSIGPDSLVGIGAVILNGARIGRGCLVGAGALVTERKEFPDHALIVGSPAKVLRILGEEELAGLRRNAVHYAERGRVFATELKKIA